jgi:hypothetical protein
MVWALLAMVAHYGGVKMIDAVASSLALNDLVARPVVELTREGGKVRVPVQQPGQTTKPHEARLMGGRGILFGYTTDLKLPHGAQVECRIRFRTMSCTGGWTPLRGQIPRAG